MTRKFTSEQELVEALSRQVALREIHGYTTWRVCSGQELAGYFGIPDLLFGFSSSGGSRTDVRAIAVEAKLTAWRDAIVQAYRYKAFAHFAYVALDSSCVRSACENISRFQQANVGLVSASPDGAFALHFRPRFERPYCSDLAKKLRNEVIAAVDESSAPRTTPANKGLQPTRFARG